MSLTLARFSIWCAPALMLGVAATSPAQSPATFHRQAVAAPVHNGWVQASSTEGHFSLEIPCAYNDGTAAPENGPSIGHDLAFIVACDRQDGVRFFAARIQYPGGRAAAENMFAQRFAGHPLAANAHISDGQMAGRSYLDFDVDQAGACLFARLIRLGEDNLLVMVEPVRAPDAPCGDLARDANRFRRSIAVTR